MTVAEWRNFLKQWSSEWLGTDEKFPAQVRKSGWLGFSPATKKQIVELEKRLGFRLPPSYCSFLQTTNGWSRTTPCVQEVRPARKVEWLEIDNPQMLDAFCDVDTPDEMANYSPEEYFSYDGRPIFNRDHVRKCLRIADPIPGDSMIYLLNPTVVAQDGEWEAWRFAHWIPGAERFPSFELLMRSEHELFLNMRSGQAVTVQGPFGGPYAPDQPRHEAERIGPGARKPQRLTIPQLIAQLEAPDRKTRLAAAKQLFREGHPEEQDHPEIVEPLSRILSSDLERDVRCAAASILGYYGGAEGIPPLIRAMDVGDVRSSAIGALFHLSVQIKDPRIGDAVARLLDNPCDYFVTGEALDILQELQDRRIAEIGLRLLDGEQKLDLSSTKTAPDPREAERFQTSHFRMQGAFAFAKFAQNPTEQLLTRLTSPNADIRAAAVAALREDKGRGKHLAKFVRRLMKDPDAVVRQQASSTLQFLEIPPPPEIATEDAELLDYQILSQIQNWKKKRKSRF
jgi:HEAT repeat protein